MRGREARTVGMPRPASQPAAGDPVADCFVDAQGVMYLTDNNFGLYILQVEGA